MTLRKRGTREEYKQKSGTEITVRTTITVKEIDERSGAHARSVDRSTLASPCFPPVQDG